ncbi:alpha/beta hydrolase [Nocardioides glacieisoli]|uniref:alpha/beta hydrolase n=1 Tax=Nocardioides glacieisoli TaxID=1168730 RepID=UPI0013ED1CFD|nr:alpha/beta hydrolase [Nocardioides glacieisoli]
MAVNSRVQARLYRPTEGALPVVLFFHGGGWVVGSINTHDQMCRELALRSGCAVLSVGYRLAPEYPFPAAVDDAEAALSWVRGHGGEHDLDIDRLAVAGDSAGGNVAAALTIRARAMGVPLRLQLLFYPVTTTDLSVGIDPQYEGLVLSREELASHQDHYLPNDTDRHRAESSPLDCADLRGLAEAVVVVAECDPIAPQGLRYAEALQAAHVPVTVHLHPGSIHGFAQFPGAFETGRTALGQAADALQRALLDERA